MLHSARMNFSTLAKSDLHDSSKSDRVYLDHNATTPIASRVAERVPGWLQEWGNPGSIHQLGRGPKNLLRQSRDKIAAMIGAHPLELVFTSGGSEANNLAIKGVFEHLQISQSPGVQFRNHYLFSSVEHPSVRKSAEYLVTRGAKVDYIPVSRSGAIDLEAYRELLTEQTALVSVMLANNETGNIYPVTQMADLAHERGALFHADCVQALGKMPLDMQRLNVDLASFAGHKFYSLKGAGVLFAKKKSARVEALIAGGGQERHRRGGTENVLAIASLGCMAELAHEIEARATELRQRRDRMETRLLSEIEGVSVTGSESPRLANTSSMLIDDVDGEALLMNLDMRGYSVSTGAACSSGSTDPSPVLLAMGLTRHEAQCSLRLGLGWGTTDDEVERFIATLAPVVRHLRGLRANFEAAQVYNPGMSVGPSARRSAEPFVKNFKRDINEFC